VPSPLSSSVSSPVSSGGHAGRAAPLPPEQRRAAIIAAALPLISTLGADVTTRQIARAAGIAEGTIFRVFPDKDSLIRAVVDSAFDPEPAIALLEAVDPRLPLRELMAEIVEIVRQRLADVWRLMGALRVYGPPENHVHKRHLPPESNGSDPLAATVEKLLQPSAAELRVTPAYAVRVLRLLVFSGTHPRISEENPLTTTDIVSILLDGLSAHAP
jgi:AcrR family transcriptional regulator